MTQPMKNLRAMRVLGLWLPMAMLMACSAAEKVKPAVVHDVVQSPGQRSITVSDAQSGAGIVLEPGQVLIVSLPIRAAAGRDWTLVDFKPGVLAAPSSKFEPALRDTNAEEGDGAMVWRFVPGTAGTVALTFDLRRVRSVQPAQRTLTYTVTVK